ncbi:MAG: efflux RND transporter periplasmic adaptor subunit, partial [Novosphingobium sp.]
MSENSGYGHSTLDAFLGTAPRRGRRHFVGIFLLVVVIVAALFLAVRFFAGSQRPYYFASAEVGDLAPQVSEQGIVRGMHDHAIRSRMNGIVARLAVTASGPVKRGQELARIDAGPLEQLLEADEAGLDGASAELRAAQTIAAEKSERFVRFERVWKESAGRV